MPDDSLEAALQRLRSADALERNDAVEALAAAGAPAAPRVEPIAADRDAGVRAAALDALGRIGAPGSADTFLRGLDDPDERVRSRAAAGLARIGHPRALEALLRTLDDAPDELHLDLTPSVLALGERGGVEAVPPLLERMASPDRLTRLHAQRALQWIVARHGDQDGVPETGAQVGGVWEENGGYRFDAPEAERAAALERWKAWLARREGA